MKHTGWTMRGEESEILIYGMDAAPEIELYAHPTQENKQLTKFWDYRILLLLKDPKRHYTIKDIEIARSGTKESARDVMIKIMERFPGNEMSLSPKFTKKSISGVTLNLADYPIDEKMVPVYKSILNKYQDPLNWKLQPRNAYVKSKAEADTIAEAFMFYFSNAKILEIPYGFRVSSLGYYGVP